MLRFIVIALAALVASQATAQEARPFATFDLASAPILNDPHDLAMGPDGRLYVADKFANSVTVLDAETLEFVETIGSGRFAGIHDISFGPGGEVILAIAGLGLAAVFASVDDLAGEPAWMISAPRTEGALYHSNGRVYVMASGAGQLAAFDGSELAAITGGHFGAHDVAEAPDGSVWVADSAAARLVQYSADLDLIKVLDHLKFGLVGPRYLDFTASGLLVVADQDAHRVLLIDPDGADGGTLLGVLGSGAPGLGPNLFDDPEGVSVQGGRYYVSDSDNNRVVRYVVLLN